MAKPGVIPLRPLALGEIVDGAISFIRGNPLVTLGLSAVVIAITQVIQIPSALAVGGDLDALTDPKLANPEVLLTAAGSVLEKTLVGAFISSLAISVLTGVLIVVLSQAVLGRKMGAGDAWRAVRGRVPGLIGISLLSILAMLLVLAIGLVPALIAYLTGSSASAVAGLALLGLLLASVVSVYLWVVWSLIGPVYVLEHTPALRTFGRSRALARPQWWRIFGILLLSGIIAFVIEMMISFPFGVLANGATLFSGGNTNAFTPLTVVIASIGAIIGGTITAPFRAGVIGLVYFDQRIRREALDITLQRATGQQ